MAVLEQLINLKQNNSIGFSINQYIYSSNVTKILA